MSQDQSNREQDLIDLYNSYSELIFDHCYFRLSDREAAKDLVQEVFLRYWHRVLTEQATVKNPKAMLFRITRNLIIDHYRRRRFESLPLADDIADPASAFEVGRETDGLDVSDRTKLEQVLRELDDKYRELFVMRYINELSPQEISKLTGLSENVVSVRLHRAVKKIKYLIETDK